MEINYISDNMLVFMFDDSIMITVLINNRSAILIDCGFPEHSVIVKEYLDDKKIIVTDILFTHYHPDHIAGSSLFENANYYCRENYDANYTYFKDKVPEGIILKKPTHLVNEIELRINDFEIKFFNGEGHSICSSIIVVNDILLCAGDLMMSDMSDKPALPGICYDGGLIMHVNSLYKIINLKPKYLIMGHGRPIETFERIEYEVNKRIYYLETLIESKGKATIDECLLDGKNNWILHNAHDSNVKYYDK